MLDDIELLRRYALRGDECAFEALVARHVDLVFSTAKRVANGDLHLAEDVAQKVFVDLAQKAATIDSNTVIAGWLYSAARFAAANAVRGERRRQTREQEAAAMQTLPTPSDSAWDAIAPMLDDAMNDLEPADRNAILLRYFQKQDFSSVGRAMGVSDVAAQKRVSRAIERLREIFVRKGVTVGTAVLGVVLSAHAVQAAPVGLTMTISTSTGCLATSSSLVSKAILIMTTKQKLTLAVAVVLLLVLGTTLTLTHRSRNVDTLNQVSAPPKGVGLEFRWVAAEADTTSPVDLLPDGRESGDQTRLRVSRNVALQADHIESATLIRDEPGRKEITVWLSDLGGQHLAENTATHLGQKLAIVWNGRVISAPTVRSQLRGRNLSVSGRFSDSETKELLNALNHR